MVALGVMFMRRKEIKSYEGKLHLFFHCLLYLLHNVSFNIFQSCPYSFLG